LKELKKEFELDNSTDNNESETCDMIDEPFTYQELDNDFACQELND
ncbi:11632_t:CDS:1, partial [Funneliformis mosseae]